MQCRPITLRFERHLRELESRPRRLRLLSLSKPTPSFFAFACVGSRQFARPSPLFCPALRASIVLFTATRSHSLSVTCGKARSEILGRLIYRRILPGYLQNDSFINNGKVCENHITNSVSKAQNSSPPMLVLHNFLTFAAGSACLRKDFPLLPRMSVVVRFLSRSDPLKKSDAKSCPVFVAGIKFSPVASCR